MPIRTVIVIVLGLVIALGAAMSLKKSGAKKPKETAAVSQVLIAATDIKAGAFVRSEAQLVMADWPKANITSSMITNLTAKPSDFNGSVARRAIQKGEAIVANLLVKSDEGGFMSAVLDPGKRAVSIAVDSTTGNAGFIFPGDHVDLILTHSISNQSVKTRASETFVENVRVLAVDQTVDNRDNKAMVAKTVTIEVTPKQAEEVNLAKDLGKISLSLRSLATGTKHDATPKPNTGDVAVKDPQNLDDILKGGGEMAPASVDGVNPNVTLDTEISKLISPDYTINSQVTIIRGNERANVKFGSPAEPANAN